MSTEVLDQTFYSDIEEGDTFSGAGPPQTLRALDPGGEPLVVKYERTIVDWIFPIFEDLCKLLYLPPNWDAYGAPQIEKESIVIALEILAICPGTPKPWVIPATNGGVQIEWHIGSIDLEIKFDPHGKGYIYYEGPEGNFEWEGNPRAELRFIQELMDRLPRSI